MVEKLLEKLNFEQGQNTRYYVETLKKLDIDIKKTPIEVRFARYHLARYGKIEGSLLLRLVEKYNLDKKTSISDIQQQLADIFLKELENALKDEDNKWRK